jgi:3-dehydroquinate synthase
MKTITVNASKTYDILIGAELLDNVGFTIKKTAGGQTAAIITDDNVSALYGKRLADTLENNGYRVVQYIFPHGEASKNADTFLSVLNFLAEEKFSRADIVIALGGGVTGDLAGFAASCYMRGIKLVQIPTTLLAMVDSSVGGKTAINLSAGKNLAGAFYQPELVVCDISLLSTLTAEAFRDGCAEIIKYGVLADEKLFNSLEMPINKQSEDVITRCAEIKRDIVAEDEFERGSRKLLNLGHTIGHAIESLSGYEISHGRAVAAGMAVETRIAVRMGMCEANCLQDILEMLRRYELSANTSYEADKLAKACLSDKKRDGGSLTMILPVKIGKCVLKEVPVNELESLIRLGLEAL